MAKPKTSISELFELTGADRRFIKKWLKEAGVGLDNKNRCIEVIQEHQRSGKQQKAGSAVDPATGLTYAQANVAEQMRQRRLENNEREMEMSKEWMKTEEHCQILKGLCTALDNVASKAKSQLGLTEEQRIGVQRILDDARKDYSGTL